MNATPVLIVRAALWIAVLRVFKFVVPLPKLVGMVRHGAGPGSRDRVLEHRIVAAVDRVASAVRFDGNGHCLERSLTLFRLLRCAGAAPQLVIGLRRDGGALAGHAWILVDGVVLGEAGTDDYVEVMAFGPAPS